jgi:hypothetical protein
VTDVDPARHGRALAIIRRGSRERNMDRLFEIGEQAFAIDDLEKGAHSAPIHEIP